MHDSGRVRRFEPGRDLDGHGEYLVDRHWSRCEPLAERPLDQLQDEKARAVMLLEAVDRGDVGMVEGRQHPCLALEAREPLRVPLELLGQCLDGDFALQPQVAGAINLAHAAPADRGEDFIRTDARAGCERHGPSRSHSRVG